MMQEIDRAIKTVLALKPDCFLDLIFGSRRRAKLRELSDSQINLPELRADKMMLIEEGRESYYLLCEAMVQPDASALPVFALKALGHQYILKKPTLVVIVYLEKGNYTTFPDSFANGVGKLSNQFRLQKILLWEHEDRILNGELKELAPFLPLFHKQPDANIIDVQKRLLQKISDPKLQADLTATAMVVDVRAFGTEVVKTKFVKEVNMLKETSIVQDWLVESEQKGWQEGKKEGKKEGEKEGKLTLLQTLFAQKFGKLPPALQLKLKNLSAEKIDRLALALLDIHSLEELRAWLSNGVANHAKN